MSKRRSDTHLAALCPPTTQAPPGLRLPTSVPSAARRPTGSALIAAHLS